MALLRTPPSKPYVILSHHTAFQQIILWIFNFTCADSFLMNEVMTGLAHDECLSSSFEHDLCPERSLLSHPFQIGELSSFLSRYGNLKACAHSIWCFNRGFEALENRFAPGLIFGRQGMNH
jgi:hypothetical protein